MGHSTRGTQCEEDKAQGRCSARETRCEGEIDEVHGRQGVREKSHCLFLTFCY